MNAYKIISEFEKSMAEFVKSPYAVAVDSCTNALFLCCCYHNVKNITIPSKTYVSVPCSIIHAGGSVSFENVEWKGSYQLKPYPIYDSACRIARNMYSEGTFQCISFSGNKCLNIGKGGMIFTDNENAYKWFKLSRYEGREEVDLLEQEKFNVIGWNMYMTPEQAARGLSLIPYLKDDQMTCNEYPDLSKKLVL